jgi:hypothetical protein
VCDAKSRDSLRAATRVFVPIAQTAKQPHKARVTPHRVEE